MKLSSKEREEALMNYPAENDMERLAIRLLLAISNENEARQIHKDANLTDEQMDELAVILKKIRHAIHKVKA